MVTESAIAILSRALLRAKFTRYRSTSDYQSHARAVLEEIERERKCPVNVYDVEDMARVAGGADLPPWCAEC